MNVTRRAFGLAAISLAGLSAAPAVAQQGVPRLKFEYLTIDPQPVTTGAAIEVIEFFWYGCPFCYQLQQPLEAWLKRKPADVEFRRIPALFRESWFAHARLYYALEALGELGRLHQQVFHAIHVEYRNRSAGIPQAPWIMASPGDALATIESTSAWAAQHGVDTNRWRAAYASPEIDRKVQEARQHTKGYALTGTPSLVVDGRYLTSTAMSESVAGVVSILEGLLVIARDRRTSGK